MANLSPKQIAGAWLAAGGAPKAVPMAVAIALAESHGDPNATNTNTDGSIDRGLWQINSVHGAQSTFDLAANAKAAVAISNNGVNWTPWSTFKNGAYKAFYKTAFETYQKDIVGLDTSNSGVPGVAQVQDAGNAVTGAAKDTAGAIGDVGSTLAKIVGDLTDPKTWLRVLEFIAGLLVGYFALKQLAAAAGTGNAKPATKTRVVPVPI